MYSECCPANCPLTFKFSAPHYCILSKQIIHICWNVRLCIWMTGSCCEGLNCLPLHGSSSPSLGRITTTLLRLHEDQDTKTLQNITQQHIPENLNSQQHQCENLKPCINILTPWSTVLLEKVTGSQLDLPHILWNPKVSIHQNYLSDIPSFCFWNVCLHHVLHCLDNLHCFGLH